MAAPQLVAPRLRQIGDAQHPAGAVIAFAAAPRPFEAPVVGYARVSTVIPIEIRAAPMAANFRRRPGGPLRGQNAPSLLTTLSAN